MKNTSTNKSNLNKAIVEKKNNLDKKDSNIKIIKISRKSIKDLGIKVMGQIALGILMCLTLFSTFVFVKSFALSVVIQLIQLGVMFYMPYSEMWYEGDRDKNLIENKSIIYDKFRALKVGLISASPFFLAYVVLLVSYFTQNEIIYTIYRILSIPFSYIIIWLTNNEISIVAYVSELRWFHTILLLLLPIFMILPSIVGYNFGLKQKSILGLFNFRKEKSI